MLIAGEPGVLGIAFEKAATFEQAADASGERDGQRLELRGGRCPDAVKAERSVRALDVDAVEQEHMEVHVQVQRAAEALDQGHRPSPRVLPREPGLGDQVRGETAVDDAERRAHDLGVVGEQEPERVRHAQHPLAHGPFGEDLVDEVGGALGHASGAAARTEAAASATEGDETLGATAVAGDAQEPVFEPQMAVDMIASVRCRLPRDGSASGFEEGTRPSHEPSIRTVLPTRADRILESPITRPHGR